MKKIKQHKHLYCTQCGSVMLEEFVGAEEYYEMFGSYRFPKHPYDKYSQENGKRNYVHKYTCPKRRWWNSHDMFFANNINFKPKSKQIKKHGGKEK